MFILLSLSLLELCLVIAFNAVVAMGHSTVNYELIYACYHDFMVRAAGTEVYSREVGIAP